MGVNKVDVGGETVLDLTGDTVSAENLIEGATAHNAAGERIAGTAKIPTKTSELTNDSGFITRLRYENITTSESGESIFSKNLSNSHECWNRWVGIHSNSVENAPESGVKWYEIITGGTANRAFQIAIGCFSTQRNVFIRFKHDAVWSNWYQFGLTQQQNNEKSYREKSETETEKFYQEEPEFSELDSGTVIEK